MLAQMHTLDWITIATQWARQVEHQMSTIHAMECLSFYGSRNQPCESRMPERKKGTSILYCTCTSYNLSVIWEPHC